MTTTTERNKAVVHRFVQAWNDRQPNEFDELIAPDVVRHCQATPTLEVRSLDQLKDLRQDTAIFPDSRQTIVHLIAEGDLVGVWATYEGTQKGSIGPLPASGNKTKFDFGGVFRIADGKIAEWWVTWDNVTVLQQLGHMPNG